MFSEPVRLFNRTSYLGHNLAPVCVDKHFLVVYGGRFRGKEKGIRTGKVDLRD